MGGLAMGVRQGQGGDGRGHFDREAIPGGDQLHGPSVVGSEVRDRVDGREMGAVRASGRPFRVAGHLQAASPEMSEISDSAGMIVRPPRRREASFPEEM